MFKEGFGMKYKKIAAVLLAAVMEIGSGLSGLYTGVPLLGDAVEASMDTFTGTFTETVQAAAPSASKLASAVKKVYGENYLPNMKLTKSEIKDRYAVASSWYASAYAEVPMMSAHVDELVIFKAKNASSKKKIVKALKNYQAKLKKDTMQYPMNLLKIQGCQVYTNENYVCFFMLGQVSQSVQENGTDEQIIKAYQQQNKKAANAVKKALK